MIFGAKEEIIPKYYDDDKPKSVRKTTFGLVRIILLWLKARHNKKTSAKERKSLQNKRFEPVCKPSSVVYGHLSRLAVADKLKRYSRYLSDGQPY